ncbi:type II toxin-antitoxin system RelE/ParE family toxin [Shouchella shacheensis]|uniref:type II toxin-antitoxin system RelE/ParE family toxin n=1 Tax=Shouchella shacheensis TaxID=1649580 RepID=UPI001C57CCC2|nr:type II toxin-antitoxin system RelE/ParE family toxin [Shouchella shacheensis]
MVITEPAEADLKEIADYIAKELQEPSTAQYIISTITEAVLDLEQMPKRHALVADGRLANEGVRKVLIDNYIAFYVVSEENQSVAVIRILYARRNWNHLL